MSPPNTIIATHHSHQASLGTCSSPRLLQKKANVCFLASTKSLTSQMPMALAQSARACSTSSLSRGSISSLSQSTGKKHAPPPMKSKRQINTKQRCSTTQTMTSTASIPKKYKGGISLSRSITLRQFVCQVQSLPVCYAK